MNIPTVKDIPELEGKTVLLRADYNVQIKNKKVVDPERIRRTFETIDYLLEHKARVVIISHLGRPKGEKVAKYSLHPIYTFLLDHYPKVKWMSDCQGAKVEEAVKKLTAGEIILLENLRYYKMEENNDVIFAKKLAQLADYYVNDAFGVSHRKHASVHEITKHVKSFAGLNMVDEIENIDRVLHEFQHPGTAIIGGVKISTKIKVIDTFLQKFDAVCIGGALCHNFLMNQAYDIGDSFYEDAYLGQSQKLLDEYGDQIILPDDFVASASLERAENTRVVDIEQLNDLKGKRYLVDIGPKTIKKFKAQITKSKTLVWNGPMGLFEVDEFAKGTNEIAKAVAKQVQGEPFGLIGGGETLAAVNNLKLGSKIDFISTGGGAMLTYIEKGTLPGLEVLKNN